MKSIAILSLVITMSVPLAPPQNQPATDKGAPLLLVQEIPLPNVGGRIDHFTFDAKRKRVVGAALGNNTVEIVDTFAGKDIHSITGGAKPHGLVFCSGFDRLFVRNLSPCHILTFDRSLI